MNITPMYSLHMMILSILLNKLLLRVLLNLLILQNHVQSMINRNLNFL